MTEPPSEPGTRAVASTCPYCGVGCGVIVTDRADGAIRVRGDETHPANFGRLCFKGAALADTLGLDERLLVPEIRGQRATWDEALDTVAKALQAIIDAHGPDAVACYVSGQLLTEDYYVANKLMKGFIGSANIDTNSRLCMSSAVAGHQRSFGADTVPANYTDIEQSELVVLAGSNTAWCHPVLFQRLRAAKEARGKLKVVVIDPRRTPTCDIADLHLPIRPGRDAFLFNGLLNYLRQEDALDWDFLEMHTEGFAAAMKAARASAAGIPAVAKACGLSPDEVGKFFHWFARTEQTLTLFSQGINQSSSGTDKVNSIINCHLATGRIGRPGAGPFSITGQPNAMGGREVGGLATTLAAHMDFGPEHVDRVARFWRGAHMATVPGLKAVELFDAVSNGRIKALWVMATNPVVSLPDADRMRAALASCELVIVSDCVRRTDTTAFAHVLLPAATWGEKDGTVTNSERRISRSRAFLPLPGEARPDWWIVTQVAHRLGFGDAFPYQHPADIFREHAELSGFENAGTRDFDISALAGLSKAEYDALTPVQWPLHHQPNGDRPFANRHFFTPSGKARFVAIHPRLPEQAPGDDFPLILNTGRVRDQWHTMTRTGKAPQLCSHTPEPVVEVHPDDGRRFGVRDGALARVFSRWGEVTARVLISAGQQPGGVFVPMHWNGSYAGDARIGAVVNPAVDPVSGEPEFKHTPVRIAPYHPDWHGFILSRQRLPEPTGRQQPAQVSQSLADHTPGDEHGYRCEYWVLAKGAGYWRYEIAGNHPIADWLAWARTLLGRDGEWLDFEDPATHRYRSARIQDGRLAACLFISPSPELPPRTWLAGLFAAERIDDTERMSLLAGRPASGTSDPGPTVCACFGIGRQTLLDTIRARTLTTPSQVGEALKAGTNCGSCVPEIKGLLAQTTSSTRPG